MCTQTAKTSKYKVNSTVIYLVVILLGIATGMSEVEPLQNLGLLISEIFIKLFKCVSLPIIALSIIVTLSQYGTDVKMQQIARRTLFYTVSTTLIAASLACVLYLIIAPSHSSDMNISHTIQAHIASQGSYFVYLKTLIPDNLFTPFIDHQVMSALFVSIVLGMAIRSIPDPKAHETISYFFKGAHSLFIIITGWIVKIIPIGLFGFITTTVIQFKHGMNIKGLGQYFMVIVLANLIQGFLILPLFLKIHKIAPFVAMRGMLPALSVAFFSKSSAGSLPITIKTIENNLGVSEKVSRFVLPLCTSINMNGCAAFIFTTVIYLMQNNGEVIHFTTMLLWIVVSTIAALGNAGVPMGCFFLSASLLTSMNVPITLLGVILPFYSLIDMVETALNVWSDSCVTKVIDVKQELA